MEKFPNFTSSIHHKITVLYGRNQISHGSKWFMAELLSASVISLFGMAILALVAGGDGTVIVFGVLLAIGMPLLMVRDLDVQIRKKHTRMILDLPEFLSTIVLLVNAGETVNRAWIRCVQAKPQLAESPLYKELILAVHELEMNTSFTKVLEDFNKRCALHEVSLFTSTLGLNYKRGGHDFVIALQSLSLELWQRRKSVSRTLGEEASSKLVFPMVLIFVVVMVIVAAPALLMMKQ
ncbi:type II secretion protein F [Paenibacillus roseipurpureus]|uniref:Type II secretion protein F n=1 Tax=Paenibacillus roseopurpureus TaxID=2918901 RepID=A0AA96LJY0_9BACL|nr:type II secretion protein F [Paenibacillus sp. MBLB1832]WNR42254.1 type II secretion protein F [Paenibacillus sp. MBLB1832]